MLIYWRVCHVPCSFGHFFFAPVKESGLFGFSFGIGQPGEELGIALPWCFGFNRVFEQRESGSNQFRWEDNTV